MYNRHKWGMPWTSEAEERDTHYLPEEANIHWHMYNVRSVPYDRYAVSMEMMHTFIHDL